MNIRERIEAFWSGERSDRIPYTILHYEWERGGKDNPAWQPLYDAGLGVHWHQPTYTFVTKNVEYHQDIYQEDGKTVRRVVRKTPVGELSELLRDEWPCEYPVKKPEDYSIMAYIVNNTEIKPNYEEFIELDKRVAPYGFPIVFGGRTPLQTILVDMVGMENFGFDLMDHEDEVMILYDALLKQYAKTIDIIAEGPGRYICMDENFTQESMGPARFAKYNVPVYEKYYPILQSSGKIVGNHFDGRLRACKELIAKAPIDVIEALTPPGEGNMTLDECRKAWPDKLFWSNIRVSDYQLPKKELYNRILDLVQQASVGGRRLAFEISENLPVNWTESMPVVLEALKETQI